MSNVSLKHAFWTPANVALITGGRWLSPPDDPITPLTGVSIDTRTLGEGEVYVAIQGERFDGHDFVQQAAEAGAAMAVVALLPLSPGEGRGEGTPNQRACLELPGDTTSPHPNPLPEGEGTKPAIPLLFVSDTVAALQRLASAYRDVLADAGTKVIAVTGSNGKTTTRHMIHTVLIHAGKTGTQSPKSFNNHLGVPLTLLAGKADDDFIVVEIGSNHPGEIVSLAKIVRPDAAVVVSIGSEHLEFFGSLENVAREELSVLAHLPSDGLAVLPADDLSPVNLSALRPDTRHPIPDTRFSADPAVPDDLPLLGEHNRHNAAAVAAIGRWMGLDDAAITEGLRAVEPVDGRMQVLRFGDVTVIHDAYNANPDSMRAAMESVSHFASRISHLQDNDETPSSMRNEKYEMRNVLILGDMFELGEAGPKEHRAIGEEVEADVLVTIGPLAMFIAQAASKRLGNERVHAFGQWTDELPQTIAALFAPGDIVLLKASRGMRFERLIPAIEAGFGPQAVDR